VRQDAGPHPRAIGSEAVLPSLLALGVLNRNSGLPPCQWRAGLGQSSQTTLDWCARSDSMTTRACTFALVLLNSVSWSCTTSTPTISSGVDSAGIRIVTAPAQDHSTPWRLAEAYRIAANDMDHPLHTIRFAGYVGVDFSGNVFLYDENVQQVEVFTPDGHPIGVRGRHGGGPGEYQFPAVINVDSGGSLFVVDFGKNAVVGFNADGSVRPQQSLAGYGHPYGGIRFWSDTAIIDDRKVNGEGHPVHSLRIVTPLSSTTLDSIVLPTLGVARIKCPDFTVMLQGVENLFAPQLQWTDSKPMIAVAVQDEYTIKIFRGVHLRRIVRRPSPKTAARREDVARLYPEGQFFHDQSCRKQADELVTHFGIAATLPLIGRLAFAPDGTLWVERYRLPGEPSAIDIYAPDDRYLGTLASAGFPVSFASRGRFLGTLADEETGGLKVILYRLEPAPW
jgi:hypothetical protein